MNKIFAVLSGALLASVLLASGSTAQAAESAASAPYPYVMPTGSMEQTIHKGQTVMAQPVTDYAGQVGDVVLFHGHPGWQAIPGDQSELFLKRVIAVGGQTIQCCDPKGRVLVDGRSLDEPYIYYLPETGPPNQASFAPVTVPPGMLWMMGDSRNDSADSRIPGHGPVPAKSVTAIVHPPSRTG